MRKGFTLVELAIVIVIIGLLVGGVLAGKELVEQAKIRAQVKQLQEYDAAVAIFRSKYGNLPGDLPQVDATKFNLTYPNAGDFPELKADGKILSNSGWPESEYTFIHLSEAKLIKENIFHQAGIYDVGTTFPYAKLTNGGIAGVSVPGGGFGFFIGPSVKQSSGNPANWAANSATPTLMPEQAWNMDMKMDDGNPQTGIVRSVQAAPALPQNTATGGCHGTVNTEYNLASNDLLCRITVKSIANQIVCKLLRKKLEYFSNYNIYHPS